MVVKINFHGGKNQFSSPVSPANFTDGYACTGNTAIWLADIRGKTCSRWPPNKALPRMPANQMRVLPLHARVATEQVSVLPVHA